MAFIATRTRAEGLRFSVDWPRGAVVLMPIQTEGYIPLRRPPSLFFADPVRVATSAQSRGAWTPPPSC
jgi:hypothetical protein